MKVLKLLIIPLFVFASIRYSAQGDFSKSEGGLEWYTDIMKANEVSKASNKPLFAFFTGSDWCGWCHKLQAHVFSKPDFIQWAKKNVVLLELDFPRGKTQSPELKQQNTSLQQTFGIQGYPTVWIFFLNKDPNAAKFNIDPLGSLGYPQGAEQGKEEIKFIKDADALFKNRNIK